ncbi:MAG: carboxymuconolactone decarboxylase family protein [Vicinamibacterales bacterium]
MATTPLIDYADASPAARLVFDDIKRTRQVDDVNNFWKALAHDPVTLGRVWASLCDAMQPGALDALTKELVYLAVSIGNNCEYCIHSHTAAARAKGMTDAQYGEFLAVVGVASQGNALATAMKVPVDPHLQVPTAG